MVNFNKLFVPEPCLYIKIMSHERRGKEGQGGTPGFQSPGPNGTPSAGQEPRRAEARQLDFSKC